MRIKWYCTGTDPHHWLKCKPFSCIIAETNPRKSLDPMFRFPRLFETGTDLDSFRWAWLLRIATFLFNQWDNFKVKRQKYNVACPSCEENLGRRIGNLGWNIFFRIQNGSNVLLGIFFKWRKHDTNVVWFDFVFLDNFCVPWWILFQKYFKGIEKNLTAFCPQFFPGLWIWIRIDPHWSAFIFPNGSGSAFNMRIRI